MALAVAASEGPTTSYDVYRAALGGLGPLGGGHPLALIEDTATFAWCSATAVNRVGDEWKGAYESFLAANHTPQRLIEGQELGTPYAVITKQRYSELFGSADLESSWRRFRESYPSGTLITISAVGLNPDKTRAVVQIGVQCGSLCGTWRDFYLERRREEWVVTPLRTCDAVS